MIGTFRIVDPDTNVERLDLNALGNGQPWRATGDPAVNEGLGLLGDLDFGTQEVTVSWVGLEQAQFTNEVVEMSFKLWALADDYDTLTTLAGNLGRELNRPGAIEWQPEGAAEPRYIDFYPSPAPNLFSGQDLNVQKIVLALMSSDGLDVTLYRHPYFRGPEAVVETFASVANGPLTREILVSNPGTAPGLMRLVVEPDAGKVVEMKVARRSQGDLTAFRSLYGFNIEDATIEPGTDTSVIADTEAHSDSVLVTTFDTVPWLRRRWRNVVTTATAGALIGRYHAYAIIRGTNPEGEFDVQLRWASGDRDPAEVSNEAVRVDLMDVNQFPFFELDLGRVVIEGDSVSLEGWAKRVSGAGGIRWDALVLMPADESFTIASVPGHRGGGSNVTTWHGSELVKYTATVDSTNYSNGSPKDHQDDKRLNAFDEAVEAPNRAEQLAAGRHSVTVEATLRNENHDAETEDGDPDTAKRKLRLGYLEVRLADDTYATDSGENVRVPLRTTNKRLTKLRKRVTWDANGTASYRFVVRSSYGDGKDAQTDPRITVHRLTHRFQRYAGAGEKLVLNGRKKQAWIASGDNKIADLHLQGGFPELAPGANLLLFSWGDIVGNAYDSILENGAVAKHDKNRSCTVKVNVIPRYLQI